MTQLDQGSSFLETELTYDDEEEEFLGGRSNDSYGRRGILVSLLRQAGCRRSTVIAFAVLSPILVILALLAVSQAKSGGQSDGCASNQENPYLAACNCYKGVWIEAKNGGRMAQFRSVPYAEPPIGQKRWRYAVPKRGCDVSKQVNATEFGSFCPQSAEGSSVVAGNEDCLQLTITVPENALMNKDHTSLPILFYIHGGFSIQGSGIWERNWDDLAAEGDFIAITINYRLNVLGYLAIRELTEENGLSSGNYGISDQIVALSWVRKYASAFGGDVNKVTLAGQSSGATSIFALLSNSKTNGMFRAAIAISGSANITMSLTTAELQNRPIVEKVGCVSGSKVLDCLRNKDVADLVRATPKSWWIPSAFDVSKLNVNGMGFAGMVIVDSQQVQQPFHDAIQNIIDSGVVLIVGGTGQESDFMAPAQQKRLASKPDFADFLETVALRSWEDRKSAAAQTVAQLYEAELNVDPMFALSSFNADYSVNCANIRMARSSRAKRTFVFETDWPPSLPVRNPLSQDKNATRQYAFHTWDYMAGLQMWDGESSLDQSTRLGYTPNEKDLEFSGLLRKHWIQVIQNGSPNESEWPAFGQDGNVFVYAREDRFPFVQSGSKSKFKQDRCDQLYQHLGLDERFYWVN